MKTTIRITGVSSIILLLFLLSTDPQELPSVFLILPFIFIFVIILTLVTGVLSIFGQGQASTHKAKFKAGMICASAPVLLLVLQSLGQLTIHDLLAVSVLFGVSYFYLSRFGVQAQT